MQPWGGHRLRLCLLPHLKRLEKLSFLPACFLKVCRLVPLQWPPCCCRGAHQLITLPSVNSHRHPDEMFSCHLTRFCTPLYTAQMGADDYTNRCQLVARLLGSTGRRGTRGSPYAIKRITSLYESNSTANKTH